jgi:LysR family transcriptional regulator of abg operon
LIKFDDPITGRNDLSRAVHDLLLARLRFRHLQLIAEIERTGSLGRAAVQLNLTQPALSKALVDLEGMLGFKLYERGPRGLTKTSQGAVLLEGASLLLRELAHVHEEALAVGANGRLAGVLRLGSTAFLAVSVLPGVVFRLTQAAPPLMVRLHEASAPMLMEQLQAGDLDALVTIYDAGSMALAGKRRVRFEPFAEERYVVIAPTHHALASSRAVTWQRMAAEPWVFTRKPSLARRFVEDSFRRHGAEPPVPVCEMDGPVTAARMVGAGVGLSSVPESTALEAVTRGAVRILQLRVPQPQATLGLVYRAAAAGHPHIAALQAALAAR